MKVGDLVYYRMDDFDDAELFLVVGVEGNWVKLFEEGPDATYTTIDNLEVISENR